jgi:glyoxylase-like metal-dependent hydrolase (beta-lactamase superfamily II)
MIFRQLFEPTSSTYTYLLGCERTGAAVLVDPVYETVERDLALVQQLGLQLAYTLETHIHADHLTGAKRAKALANSQIAGPKMDGLSCIDAGVEEGRAFQVGDIAFQPLFTPGHTDTHHAYLLEQHGAARVFTGDCLLIDGCGRTDFQNGDTRRQFQSIREKLFSLPDDTLVYPCHDYQGRFVSSIAQEKTRNPRIGLDKDEAEFIQIMDSLNLPYPKRIDLAVPVNRLCGECPPDLPEELQRQCPAVEPHDQG